MVTIIDYGIGNIRSIEKAFQTIGTAVRRSDEPETIRDAERLVLPGVGAFGACINEIRRRDLEGAIVDAIRDGTPFLGVCVGMQLLFERGLEKGEHRGLGVLPGRVVHFHETATGSSEDLVVPHMGWNTVTPRRDDALLTDIGSPAYAYFVHSFHAVADEPDDVVATTTYGHEFPCVVRRGNVCGVQFHPEKSQYAGLAVLDNFTAVEHTGAPSAR